MSGYFYIMDESLQVGGIYDSLERAEEMAHKMSTKYGTTLLVVQAITRYTHNKTTTKQDLK